MLKESEKGDEEAIHKPDEVVGLAPGKGKKGAAGSDVESKGQAEDKGVSIAKGEGIDAAASKE